MHPATQQAIYGMIQVVRQSLVGIEAILAAEDSTKFVAATQDRNQRQGDGTESLYCNEQEERVAAEVAKMFGMEPVDGSK
jgi:hypothetical protein